MALTVHTLNHEKLNFTEGSLHCGVDLDFNCFAFCIIINSKYLSM
jgi:hypothetical protein